MTLRVLSKMRKIWVKDKAADLRPVAMNKCVRQFSDSPTKMTGPTSFKTGIIKEKTGRLISSGMRFNKEDRIDVEVVQSPDI